jgi:tRNA A37 threonylcarbamoyladenosine dehydratase
VLLVGPGAISLDAMLGFSLAPELRLALLGIGLVGGFATLALQRAMVRQAA